jgi:hypothetical protein
MVRPAPIRAPALVALVVLIGLAGVATCLAGAYHTEALRGVHGRLGPGEVAKNNEVLRMGSCCVCGSRGRLSDVGVCLSCHACATAAAEALQEWLHFLRSGLDGLAGSSGAGQRGAAHREE